MFQETSILDSYRLVSAKDALAKIELDDSDSLSQQLYVTLRRLAVELVLLPNQFLSEKDVASNFAISKTPVREAFIRLAEDGVVRIMPKSGTYISPVDYQLAEEGFFIWGALESSCAASLAEHRTFRDISTLREAVSNEMTAERHGNITAFRTANNSFHATIFNLSDFPEAKRLTISARFEADRVRNLLQQYRCVSMRRIVACHSEIVNAIAAGDAKAAEAALTGHIAEFSAAMHEMLKSEEFRLFHEFLNQKRMGKRRTRKTKETE